MPAHTILSGLGSTLSNNCIPKPVSLLRAPVSALFCIVFGAGLFDSRISFSGTRPGFFFFSTASMELSRSGNEGISSKTVANTSVLATILSYRSRALVIGLRLTKASISDVAAVTTPIC
ncbi:hypothetical protein GQX74_001857 [Glossina fuscipes]|nr:hypothetical protein GQX74_001857 [Glossina fuscipes]